MFSLRVNIYLVWTLIATSFFVSLNVDSMWSWSVDLAHHYALAFRISEHWTLLSNTDPTLGEMNIYPRGAHIIAAIIGGFVGSTFLGVQLTSLLAFSLLWLSIIYILKSLPGLVGVAALGVALSLFLTNHYLLGFQLHGNEIVGNFFFSQFVAQAFLFFCLVFAINVEKKEGALVAGIVLMPFMLIAAFIHLLPALQLLGVIVCLVIVLFCCDRKTNGLGLDSRFIALFVLCFSFVGMLLHPSFLAMKAISENNGALELYNISYPFGLVAICLLVLAFSFILFFQWYRKRGDKDYLAAKYLAIYGLVTVGLCLIQYILTYYGKGSDYAVKKYGFCLITILFMQLSIAASMLLAGDKKVSLNFFEKHVSRLNLFFLSCLSLVVLFLNTPKVKSLDVSSLVSLERKLISRFDLFILDSEKSKPNVVIGLDGYPSTIDYMFSIAIAKTPRAIALHDVLARSGISEPNDFGYIISSSSNKAFGSIGCESLVGGDVSIIESTCVADRLANANKCSSSFDFTLSDFLPVNLLKGFSSAEDHGRWTDGFAASFQCTSDGMLFNTVKIELAPFTYGALRSQRLQLLVNGMNVYEGKLADARGVNNPLVVDLKRVPVAESYVFTFKMPDAVSPKLVGLSEDGRTLGFSLRRISFD